MKDETRQWFNYAQENLGSARAVFKAGYLNTCLQNCQQTVEKAMKCLLIEFGLEFRKTHNIRELKGLLANARLDVGIADDDCHFLDAVYLPSRYPVASALPNAKPDRKTCQHGMNIAEQVMQSVQFILDRIKR